MNYLNNRLSEEQINQHAHQIWILAIKFNYTEDLTLLPTSLPNVRNGLADVSSRDFYQRLCNLRPDLAGTNIVTELINAKFLWGWLQPNYRPDVLEEDPFDGFSIFFEVVTRRVAAPMMIHKELISMLLHIPLRQYWTDDPSFIEFCKLDKIEVFVIAGCFGHVKLFYQLLDELMSLPEDRLQSIIETPLSTVCNYLLPILAH
ncbi:hypothetical protein HDU76_007992, partial [Blyttiomyces sp. JEL0837]